MTHVPLSVLWKLGTYPSAWQNLKLALRWHCNENGVFHCSCVPTCPHDYVRTSNAVVFQAPSQQQEQLSFGWRMKTTTFLRFLVSSRFVRRMECSALWWWWPKTKIRVPFLPHSPSVYQITMMAHGLWKVLMVSGCLCTRWSAKCIFLIKSERKGFFFTNVCSTLCTAWSKKWSCWHGIIPVVRKETNMWGCCGAVLFHNSVNTRFSEVNM